MHFRRIALGSLVVATVVLEPAWAASPGASGIQVGDLREWLTYIASDELEGRGDFGPGLGLAAAYVEDHLHTWGVKPGGDGGSYLQTVVVQGVRATSHSVLTVQVGNEKRTFRDGEGVSFPKQAGVSRILDLDRVEFVGYGLDARGLNHRDFLGRDIRGQAVVWLGSRGPKEADGRQYRGLLAARSKHAVEELLAAAVIGPELAPRRDRDGSQPAATQNEPDFTTADRLDKSVPPAVTGSDVFFTFLFSRAPMQYDELKRRADAEEPLPSFRLDNVKLTFNISVEYTVVRTQFLKNIIGIVEGTDPQLKSTYVAVGAHYDHVGYSQAEIGSDGTLPPPPFGIKARDNPSDRIWNGADDDGSGTVGVMALSKAFATGPRPRRSLLFVWHSGEEIGTYGSRYFADHPTVPIERIVAQLNIDMIGRNRDDKSSEANTVYLVGSDRISSELHEISREANRSLALPMTFNYELNDATDPQQFYYRSDHYSYAEKGIPVIFFTTGLHPDYHRPSDEVTKILFDKLAHVTQLIYETTERLADLDHAPVRDYQGARAGKDTK